MILRKVGDFETLEDDLRVIVCKLGHLGIKDSSLGLNGNEVR